MLKHINTTQLYLTGTRNSLFNNHPVQNEINGYFPVSSRFSNIGRCSSILSRVSCARSSALTKIPGGLILLALLKILSFYFQSQRRQKMVLGRLAESVAAYAFLTRSARSICGSSSRSSFSLSISFTLVSVLSQVSASSSRMPSIGIFFLLLWFSSRIYNLFSVIIFEGTAHHFNLFFDFMQSG